MSLKPINLLYLYCKNSINPCEFRRGRFCALSLQYSDDKSRDQGYSQYQCPFYHLSILPPIIGDRFQFYSDRISSQQRYPLIYQVVFGYVCVKGGAGGGRGGLTQRRLLTIDRAVPALAVPRQRRRSMRRHQPRSQSRVVCYPLLHRPSSVPGSGPACPTRPRNRSTLRDRRPRSANGRASRSSYGTARPASSSGGPPAVGVSPSRVQFLQVVKQKFPRQILI